MAERAWFGSLPDQWDVLPGRALFHEVLERGHPDEPSLSVTIANGVIEQRTLLVEESKKDSSNEDKSAYKLVEPGDIAYNKMRAWQGAVGLSDHRGIVSPAYVVMRPRTGCVARYLHYLLRTPAFATEAERWSYGISSDQWSLRPQHFKMIRFPVPSVIEQDLIVRFLDHADRRIRRAIHAKQKLIALLTEQRQVVVARLVTPGTSLRPFIRCVIDRSDYRGATPEKTDDGIFLVTAKNIRKGWIDYESSAEFVAEAEYARIMRRGLPKNGDLLLTTEAPLGNAALVDREDVALAQRVIRFRMDPRLFEPRFVLHSVLAPYFQDQLQCRGTGSTAVGIKASKLPQLQIFCPPLAEQHSILANIEGACDPIVRDLDKAQREIELLREYRTRLIADAVTGKLDVRTADPEPAAA